MGGFGFVAGTSVKRAPTGLETRGLGAEKGRSVLRPCEVGFYQVTRTRYLRVAVAFLSMGIWNWAAHAEVLVAL
jgi:hypothetical protein